MLNNKIICPKCSTEISVDEVLAPSHKLISSLYKSLIDNKFYTFLDNENVKKKIATKK